MFRLLLRTHFDKHNKFDVNVIESDPLFTPVVKEAVAKGLDLEEFCFQEIGYVADADLTAKQRYKKRCDFARKSQPAFVNSKSKFKRMGVEPSYFQETVHNSEHDNLVRTVVNFIENTDHIRLGDQTSAEFLHVFKYIGKKGVTDVLANEEGVYYKLLDAVLANAVQVEGLEECYAIGGKLYVNKFSDLQKPKIVNTIIRHSLTRQLDVHPKHFFGLLNILYCYQLSDISTTKTKFVDYLKLVDLASIYNCSIKEFIELCGFRYTSQEEVLRKCGLFIFPAKDSYYQILNPYNDEEQTIVNEAGLRKIIRDCQEV